jgi:hypothetical protein
MGNASVGSGSKGGRRALDSEINMIPMIDLLMVTISFLLITAVWSHSARLQADARAPGPPDGPVVTPEPDKQLHVDMRDADHFVLTWKQGRDVLASVDVPRREVVALDGGTRVVRFPDLAEKVAAEWVASSAHKSATDARLDQAVLHTGSDTPYAALIGAIDAVYQVHRPLQLAGRAEVVPAFHMTLAVD